MNARENLEFPNLYNFFVIQKNICKILNIIDRKKRSVVSLSLLDWFVTNYVKKNQICYYVNKKHFDIYIEYKAQLTDYHKDFFDPFNRGDLIKLQYDTNKNDYIHTTFRQLNFLRWVIKNKIIKYIEDNVKTITLEYEKFKQNKKKNKEKNKRTVNITKPKNITVRQEKTVKKFIK